MSASVQQLNLLDPVDTLLVSLTMFSYLTHQQPDTVSRTCFATTVPASRCTAPAWNLAKAVLGMAVVDRLCYGFSRVVFGSRLWLWTAPEILSLCSSTREWIEFNRILFNVHYKVHGNSKYHFSWSPSVCGAKFASDIQHSWQVLFNFVRARHQTSAMKNPMVVHYSSIYSYKTLHWMTILSTQVSSGP